ncbi:MAG: molecular chaperone HtpG [Rhodovibrionaceae bacterium]
MTQDAQETLSFQAEVSRLLDIVANSLYSNKEIFLRELVSNASDACDRLRYLAITDPGLISDDPEFKIQILPDKEAGTLTVVDNGIGMNRGDLIENLGTIAHSGSSAFLSKMEKKDADLELIGQFGVGFYSAFMVAERVVVESRKAGESENWRWESDGTGGFSITDMGKQIAARGTKITLHLKKDEQRFLEERDIQRIVRSYSDHIGVPILLGGGGEAQQLNSASAIWTRPKSEISKEQYTEFYHHVAHAFDDPWHWMHFHAEGVIEYSGLLYIPSQRPHDLFDPARSGCVRLYVKRVFITEDCETLVPPYLRFLRGVIDSQDISLNVSREHLQHDPVLTKIRNGVVKRVLETLRKKAGSAPEDYAVFWEAFGPVLKEGIYEDSERRAALLELARFRSSAVEGWTSLADYKARMQPGQSAIYYISGDSAAKLKDSPQIEGFLQKGIEVLLLTDPVDDFWVPSVGSYEETLLSSVTRAGTEFEQKDEQPETASEDGKDSQGAAPEIEKVIAFMKQTLKDDVKDVRRSKRLANSPVCLVADDGDLDLHLARVLSQHREIDAAAQRVLEINPNHALIRQLSSRLEGADKDGLADAARLLLDQARILEGEPLPDPGGFSRRLAACMERGLSSAAE